MKKQEIAVVEETKPDVFTTVVNDFLSLGFKISSTSCGFMNSESYNFCSCFQAILVKEEEES